MTQQFGFDQSSLQRRETAVYEMFGVELKGKTPRFTVRPSTERNSAYFKATLKKAGRTAQRVRRQGLTAAIVKKGRGDDYELFPKFVIEGWEDVVDGAGNPVPYSPEQGEAFLRQVPTDAFDDMREFCANESNFAMTEDDDEPLDSEDLGNVS